MKEFNLEEAKQGKPVCTRDGHKVTILSFEVGDYTFPIVALIHYENHNEVQLYTKAGEYVRGKISNEDLFMDTEHKA